MSQTQPNYYVSTGPVTDQQPTDSALVAVAWVITVLTGGYMLPWAIAVTRGKSNQGAIGLIDLLLGWTVVGWFVALVMACSAHRVLGWGQQPWQALPPAGWYPAPDGQGQQYWDGRSWTGHRAP